MPTYVYKCTACEVSFEITRPMGSAGLEPCPECGSDTKRVFTPVGVSFKGPGFHNTDYRQRPAEPTSDAPSACPAKDPSSGGCAGCPAAKD